MALDPAGLQAIAAEAVQWTPKLEAKRRPVEAKTGSQPRTGSGRGTIREEVAPTRPAHISARIRKSPKLQTREARSKLSPRKEPYWHQIEPGLSLGYYKGTRGGRRIVRKYDQGTGKYHRAPLGTADDYSDGDGESVLTFAQAQRQAQGDSATRKVSGYTVENAIDDYLRGFQGRSRSETVQMIEHRIRPKLGDRPVAHLTTEEIEGWQRWLLEPRDEKDQKRRDANPEEWTRKRRATANRVLTVLKAVLNRAYRRDKVASNTAWDRVQPYKGVDKPRRRYLTHAESVRFVNVCDPDFRPLARAALLTGGRYGELTAMRVGDYNPDSGTAHFVDTKSGQDRHVPLTDEGQALFEELTAGRMAGERMFLNASGKPWGKNHQQKPMRDACKRAGIDPPIRFHILRHTYGSLLAREGVQLQVIATLMGHADTRMTERHYAHLQPDHVSEALRAALPNFGTQSDKVTHLQSHKTAK